MQPRKATVAEVLDDLIAEQDALDAVIAALDRSSWELATASPGWSVRDQIGHLTYFDRTAALAINDPEQFAVHRAELFSAEPADDDDLDAATLGAFRAMDVDQLLAAWRDGRQELAQAGRTLGEDARVEWYGPSMGARSFLTARLMEAWAHGQDVVDAVGAVREPSDRLRHIVQLGVITRGWSYLVRGEEPPAGDVSVILDAPDGAVWSWGADDGSDRVVGRAEDFCLVVTQRRHVDDTALTITDGPAREWMERAQAFAGGPTTGPAPREQNDRPNQNNQQDPS